MGLRDGVAKTILTELIIKAALGCTTPAELVEFVRVLGEGLEGASLKECEAAFLRFPPHVVTKILQRGRYGSDGYCCKKDLNKTFYERRTKVYNTSRLVAFLRVLGESVEGAFLKECEAAFLRFPMHVVNKIWQGVGTGLGGIGAKKILTPLVIKGALRCTTH